MSAFLPPIPGHGPGRTPARTSADDPSRRCVLAHVGAWVGVAMMAAALPAQAAEGGGGKDGEDPEVARRILLPPMTLPGPTAMSFIQLQVRVVVKKNKDLLANIAKVNDMKPRIVSAVTMELTEHHVTHQNLTTEDVETLKQQIIDAANDALDAKLIENVLIVSLLTG